MIGYLMVGTNDLTKACAFYDALLVEIDAKRFMEEDTFVAWSANPKQTAFCVAKPFNGQPATIGNGSMVAFAVDSTDKVHSLYAKALSLGGTDEGAPGPRGDHGFYAAYFRDLDGNKLNVFCMES